jgi:hypothetical protein
MDKTISAFFLFLFPILECSPGVIQRGLKQICSQTIEEENKAYFYITCHPTGT